MDFFRFLFGARDRAPDVLVPGAGLLPRSRYLDAVIIQRNRAKVRSRATLAFRN